MAGRILNRRELREQADEAATRESLQDPEATDEDDEVEDTGDACGDEAEGRAPARRTGLTTSRRGR
jgi:hypothetical protein